MYNDKVGRMLKNSVKDFPQNGCQLLMDEEHRYTRVIDIYYPNAQDQKDNEYVMYEGLTNKEATLLSSKFNNVHSAVKKRTNRDFKGLLRILKLESDRIEQDIKEKVAAVQNSDKVLEEIDRTLAYKELMNKYMKLRIFYCHYGIGVFANPTTKLPDEFWEVEEVYVPNEAARYVVELIVNTDNNTKTNINQTSLEALESAYKLIKDARGNIKISLDDIDVSGNSIGE